MEDYNKIVPPHLNAEVYRMDTTWNCNLPFLDYVRHHSDGSVLVGSSELTGRYWDGGASIFKDFTEAKSIEAQERRSISLPSGTADGCFVGDSNKVLLCEDSGAISIWTMADDKNAWHLWREEKTVVEHDGAVLAVDCIDPGKQYVTIGADGNAKVWDVNEMICIRHYEAHSMTTFAVSVRPKSTSNFATGSQDEHVSLWDENTAKPVQDLVKNDCGVRCVQWLDENRLVYGDEAGILRLVDVRNTDEQFKLTEFPAAVHKIAVNSENDKVAVCCDNSIVSVCEISGGSKCEVVYHDRHMHSNFVRGLAWDRQNQNLLHTVGWDSVLKSHSMV